MSVATLPGNYTRIWRTAPERLRLSGVQLRPPLKATEHHGTMTPRDLRAALKLNPQYSERRYPLARHMMKCRVCVAMRSLHEYSNPS